MAKKLAISFACFLLLMLIGTSGILFSQIHRSNHLRNIQKLNTSGSSATQVSAVDDQRVLGVSVEEEMERSVNRIQEVDEYLDSQESVSGDVLGEQVQREKREPNILVKIQLFIQGLFGF